MQVKGTAVATIPIFVNQKFGEQKYKEWLEKLSPQAKAVLSANVLVSSWYPLKELLIEPTQLICDMFYGGKTQGAVEQGRFSADHGLKGIYKLFVRFGTVDFIISKASVIMPTYYSGSAMEVVSKGDKKTVVRTTKFDEPHTLVENRIKGWVERALEISGAKTPRCDITCSMTSGSPYTDFTITWS